MRFAIFEGGLFYRLIGAFCARKYAKAFNVWGSGNVNNVGENRDDCESSVEGWRGLSLRQYTPGKKIEGVFMTLLYLCICWEVNCDGELGRGALIRFLISERRVAMFCGTVVVDCLESLM